MKKPRGRPITINFKAMNAEEKKAYQRVVSRRKVDRYVKKMRQIDFENLRECKHCRQKKERSEENFYKNKNAKFGFATICKKCSNAASRRYALRANYGGSVEDYEAVMTDAACAICGGGERLCLDHCHDKGHVRGVLCRTCNLMLGFARDDQHVLQNAINYLARTKNGM